MNANPILTAAGAFLAPPQSSHDARPAGPWLANAGAAAPRLEYEIPRSSLRGAGVREALAGEVPISAELAAEIAHGRRV